VVVVVVVVVEVDVDVVEVIVLVDVDVVAEEVAEVEVLVEEISEITEVEGTAAEDADSVVGAKVRVELRTELVSKSDSVVSEGAEVISELFTTDLQKEF